VDLRAIRDQLKVLSDRLDLMARTNASEHQQFKEAIEGMRK
jgi:hypothetical protein